MQSGISASKDLHAAFTTFLNDTTLFALPCTIQSESIVPLDTIPFPSSSTPSNSNIPSATALQTLAPHLQPSTPIYLLLRPTSTSPFTAITYVPSTSPVRQKTLFAASRAALVRELGQEKFSDTLFATDAEEILEVSQWEDRARGTAGGGVDEGLLSREERELQSVKRAEEEGRHGTSGRSLGGMGGGGDAQSGGTKLQMKMTGEAREALRGLSAGGRGGEVVQLGIDLASETLELLRTEEGVDAGRLAGVVPGDRPSYTFYRHPKGGQAGVLFVYVCPGTSKVKERMVYASSRSGVLEAAKAEGVQVSKRLEAGDPEEVTEQRLDDEVGAEGASEAGAAKGGFARPKRPGRR